MHSTSECAYYVGKFVYHTMLQCSICPHIIHKTCSIMLVLCPQIILLKFIFNVRPKGPHKKLTPLSENVCLNPPILPQLKQALRYFGLRLFLGLSSLRQTLFGNNTAMQKKIQAIIASFCSMQVLFMYNSAESALLPALLHHFPLPPLSFNQYHIHIPALTSPFYSQIFNRDLQ